jgi:hypothetical protein
VAKPRTLTKFVKIKRNVPKLPGGAAGATPAIDGLDGRTSMGDLINLRTARKQAQRRRAEQQAASNRLAHGRPKTARTLEQSRSKKATRDLDAHRIESGDPE